MHHNLSSQPSSCNGGSLRVRKLSETLFRASLLFAARTKHTMRLTEESF